MKKIDLRSLTVSLLGLMLVFSLVFSAGLRSEASEKARLGSSLSEVLLHWRLMVVKNQPSYAGESGLESSLVSLEDSLKSLNSPGWLSGRIPPLREKLEKAKTGDLWPYQFGFWNFALEDSTVSLSGAERNEDILVDGNSDDGTNSRGLKFPYLKFSDGQDSATIDVGEKLDKPLSESFTLEFWVRVRESSVEKVVSSDNWKLSLEDNLPVLKNSSNEKILEGGEIPLNNWTHVGLIKDSNQIRLYLNGNEVSRSGSSGSLNISKVIDFGGGLVGDIDELRVRNKAVEPEYLNFDRPINYLIGFPLLDWAQASFTPEEQWRFYAGLLTSNIKLKMDGGIDSINGEGVNQVAEFLLSTDEPKLELPSDIPSGLVEDMKELRKLGNNDELTEEEKEDIESFIENLTGYLDLG
ncbi:LamG domain-containing protein [Candidatus Bipolaricaulota bacterium]|nr:LamG domain-containing protein [Candidatus Bipolaricaulota bacterium]